MASQPVGPTGSGRRPQVAANGVSNLDRLLGITPTRNIWNRGLPEHVTIMPRVLWPLYFWPLMLFSQLVTPSPVWIGLTVAILGFWGLAYLWVRIQSREIHLSRQRRGLVLVAGDALEEEFTVENQSPLPALWVEFEDNSDLPGYRPGRVVGCGGQNRTRWRSRAECKQRGVYRLGPHRLRFGDPLGLFQTEVAEDLSELVLVYPRVVKLPQLTLPRGSTSGRDRRRRPMGGSLRSASVRGYVPGDSLRHIHWPTTAHRGELTVTELEIEPSGDLWIALDLNQAVHQGSGESGTFEYSIILAASLAAELLSGGERRAVGLLAAGGEGRTILLPPLPGKAQLWQIMAALAPLQPGPISLAQLLNRSRDVFGRGRTVVVITPALNTGNAWPNDAPHASSKSAPTDSRNNAGARWAEPDDWVTELAYLQSIGLSSSALLVLPATGKAARDLPQLQSLLAGLDVPVQPMQAGQPMQAVITYRRTRTVLRTTPTGGVVTYEVEEEVG